MQGEVSAAVGTLCGALGFTRTSSPAPTTAWGINLSSPLSFHIHISSDKFIIE